ncbi:energy transducer TonB [uncultured Sphingomonas sp.]|uniref:energy transducer TonB n=1 Tax=uncultured Sphingomonas sp. TaxID=158754 RepID=UPI0025E59EF9|nr:energy transducer TonB [uncultured Sphingomonas sp.]
MKSFGIVMAVAVALASLPPADGQTRGGKSAGVKGNPGEWFSPENYPPEARRRGIEGRVLALMKIDATGAVVDCIVTKSSGSSLLDEGTCSVVRTKGRFTPATDRRGRPIASDYPLAVKWALEDADLSEGKQVVEVDVSESGNPVMCRGDDIPATGRCPPDVAAMVAILSESQAAHTLEFGKIVRFGETSETDQALPRGADVVMLRVNKVFVNEVGKVIDSELIEQRGFEHLPPCPFMGAALGIVRNESGLPKTTWSVMTIYVVRRPGNAPAAKK